MAYYLPVTDNDWCDDEVDDSLVAQKEWKRTENDMRKTGYRLGLSAGQEETLQEGFNNGYAEGAATAFEIGELQGRISASLTILESTPPYQESRHPETGSLRSNLMKLMEDCAQLQQTVAQHLQAQSLYFKTVDSTNAPHKHTQIADSEFQNRLHATESAEQQSSVRAADSKGDFLQDISDHLNAVDLEEIPSVHDLPAGKTLQELLLQYNSLWESN